MEIQKGAIAGETAGENIYEVHSSASVQDEWETGPRKAQHIHSGCTRDSQIDVVFA